MTVRVDGPFASTTIAAGDELRFGRFGGPGRVTYDDLTVSAHHGTILHEGDSWSIVSTATYLGVEACDAASTATVVLPVGVGPITIPFPKAFVVIHGREAQHVLVVEGPVVTSIQRPPTPKSTDPVFDRGRCFDRSGRPLRWFQALVALCEPTLSGPSGHFAAVPSDQDLKDRLDIGSSTLERALARAREELGLAPRTPQLRVTISTMALRQGLVTPGDLCLLRAERIETVGE